VRVVRSLLAVKIRLPVPAVRIDRRFVAILWLEAFHRRPGFDQRTVDREVVRAEQPLDPRPEPPSTAWRQCRLPAADRGSWKRSVIPRRVVDADADKPAKQKIELQPLHQLPLRADRIERLQQHRWQQLLRRDRRPAHPPKNRPRAQPEHR
jgi:hypothetical protein